MLPSAQSVPRHAPLSPRARATRLSPLAQTLRTSTTAQHHKTQIATEKKTKTQIQKTPIASRRFSPSARLLSKAYRPRSAACYAIDTPHPAPRSSLGRCAPRHQAPADSNTKTYSPTHIPLPASSPLQHSRLHNAKPLPRPASLPTPTPVTSPDTP